ncbi:MAG: UvrD/REP helicase family protein [Edafosvirus sp.]|uniref:UvrD/REP helicase family protein n=1 Tax=Edafosvirus sp. TaxID=2487765 RepID=A0A3G4ZUP4_9VIRU|nr:MAG: UvrD/REP helicase family protein [Edafosvirus sp.]
MTNYNEEQIQFIESKLINSKLYGVPGGGKTQSIIGKIVHHYENNDFKNTNEYIILTFSRRARNDFLRKGKKYRVSRKKLFNTKNIRTIHSLTGSIVSSMINRNSSSLETIVIVATDIIQNNDKKKLMEIKCLNNLKAIFVDESQDISDTQNEFITTLCDKLNCIKIMVGDANQTIYQFQNGSDQYLLNYNADTYNLKKNYRSTKQIIEFSNHFRPWKDITIKIEPGTDNIGPKPIIFIGTIDEIKDDIINEIQLYEKDGNNLENIAIIGPVKRCKPNDDGTYTNIGLSLATNELKKNNIKFIKHYSDTSDDGKSSGEQTCDSEFGEIHIKKNYVNVITCHGSKGLEFKKVLLLNFHFTTFGRRPTLKEYNIFKYLWYVGITRACTHLKIYILKDKDKKGKWIHRIPFPALLTCPSDLYEMQGEKLHFNHDITYEEEKKQDHYNTTEVLKKMDDRQFKKLEDLIKFDIEVQELYDAQKIDTVVNGDKIEALLGIFVENVFEYFYKRNLNQDISEVYKLRKKLDSLIYIPNKYRSGYQNLKERYLQQIINVNSLNVLATHKNEFSRREKKFYNWICKKVNNDLNKEIYLVMENDIIYQNRDELLKICQTISSNDNNELLMIENIFKLSLYIYQMDTENAYLWTLTYKDIADRMDYYIDNIKKIVNKNNCLFDFQRVTDHPNFNLFGVYDILTNEGTIIDLKFTKHFPNKHIYQVFLYYNLICPSWKKSCKMEIWNLMHGKKYVIKFVQESRKNKYEFLKLMCNVMDTKMNNNIFIYDLETTGLDILKLSIIERYFHEYQLDFVASDGLIKLENGKKIPIEVEKLTKITNNMVQMYGDNNNKFKDEMINIFKYCKNPIFIAHNGNVFDHQILERKKIFDKNNKYVKLDSKVFIRLFAKQDTLKLKLGVIYEQVMGKKYPVAHRAKDDVIMVIQIMEKLNITAKKVYAMANTDTEIQQIKPGNDIEQIDYVLNLLNKNMMETYLKLIFNKDKILNNSLKQIEDKYVIVQL